MSGVSHERFNQLAVEHNKLEKVVEELEKRVVTVEKNSHPPLDLEPAIREILQKILEEEQVSRD